MMIKKEPNGWMEWSKYVLKELERLNSCYKSLDNKVDKLIKEMTIIKVKFGIVSAGVAIVVAGITSVAAKMLLK